MRHKKILRQVDNYYTQKLKEYGPTHKGVDWNSEESQNLRFDQLLKVTGDERNCSILDFGCGYGAMARYLRARGYKGHYTGFDISRAMIKKARDQKAKLSSCTFASDIDSLGVGDYTVASGLFNVKQEVSNEEWQAYVLDTISDMVKHSRKGFSFNMLTSYSDKDKMRPDLFYADPCFFFDRCMRNFSRHVAILHDYGLYEFTILVRMK